MINMEKMKSWVEAHKKLIADGVKGVVEDCFTGSHADVRVLRNEVVE